MQQMDRLPDAERQQGKAKKKKKKKRKFLSTTGLETKLQTPQYPADCRIRVKTLYITNLKKLSDKTEA